MNFGAERSVAGVRVARLLDFQPHVRGCAANGNGSRRERSRRFPRGLIAPSPHQINEHGRSRESCHRADRQFRRSHHRARQRIRQHDHNRAADRRSRNQQPVIRAEDHAHHVRHQQSDITDRAAHRNRQARQHRRRHIDHQLHAIHVHAQMPRFLLARQESDSDRTTWCTSRPPPPRTPKIEIRASPQLPSAAAPKGRPSARTPCRAVPRPVSMVSRNMIIAERNDAATMPASTSVALSSCPPRRPRK